MPRISPKVFSWAAFLALATLSIIILTGAGVRLTGSGLGCPDWPTCIDQKFIPTNGIHAKIEWYNRVFTGVCSAAVILAILASVLRKPRRKDLTWLSISLALGIIAQAVLGGFSVWYGLAPPFVMAHYLLSMVIIAAAFVLFHRSIQPDGPVRPTMSKDFIILVRVLVGMAFVVMFVGTMVTGSGPHGGDENATRLPFSPHDITKVHAGFVWLFLATVVFTIWRLRKGHAGAEILAKAEALLVALVLQGAIGYLQYAYGVPAWMVIIHIAGSIAVWISVLRLNSAMFDRWESYDIPPSDGQIRSNVGAAEFINPGSAT